MSKASNNGIHRFDPTRTKWRVKRNAATSGVEMAGSRNLALHLPKDFIDSITRFNQEEIQALKEQIKKAGRGDRGEMEDQYRLNDPMFLAVTLIMESLPAACRKKAVVLGSGTCRQIPLLGMALTFSETRLIDLDQNLLDAAMIGVSPDLQRKIGRIVSDISGANPADLHRISEKIKGAKSISTELVADLAAVIGQMRFDTPYPLANRKTNLVVSNYALLMMADGLYNFLHFLFEKYSPGGDLGAFFNPNNRAVKEAMVKARTLSLRHYFGEMARTLAPGGKAIIFFDLSYDEFVSQAEYSSLVDQAAQRAFKGRFKQEFLAYEERNFEGIVIGTRQTDHRIIIFTKS